MILAWRRFVLDRRKRVDRGCLTLPLAHGVHSFALAAARIRNYGVYQMAVVYARSWMLDGTSVGSLTPKTFAS